MPRLLILTSIMYVAYFSFFFCILMVHTTFARNITIYNVETCSDECASKGTANMYYGQDRTSCPLLQKTCIHYEAWMKCTLTQSSAIVPHWSYESYATFSCLVAPDAKRIVADVQSRLFAQVKDPPFHLFPAYKERQREILYALASVLHKNVRGDIVEFGTFEGVTTAAFRMLAVAMQREGVEVHGYDSFEGLPESDPSQTIFRAGDLAVPQERIDQLFDQLQLQRPILHKGYFNETKRTDIPTRIAFAYIDGDFYESVAQALHLVWDNVAPGGVVVFDDYYNVNLPGVSRAVDEFIDAHPPLHVQRLWQSNGKAIVPHAHVEALLFKPNRQWCDPQCAYQQTPL